MAYISIDIYEGVGSIQQDRITYLDGLRVLATLAVVLLHVSAGYWGSEEVTSAPWMIATFYDGMVRWCVPVFVMISGALLLDPEKEARIGSRIRKVLISLVVWSAVYASIDFYRGADRTKSIENFLAGHYHLWYLYMLIGLYLALPLLKRITGNEKHEAYFLMLACIFNFIIPQITGILNLAVPAAGSLLEIVTGKMSLQFVLGYSGYFVLGHWLHHHVLAKKDCVGIYLAGSLGFILTVILTFTVSVFVSHPEKLFFSYFSINVMFEAVAVFLAFRQIRYTSGSAVWMKKLSDCSFGIFLIHPLVLETLSGLFPEMNQMMKIPVAASFGFLLSLGITAVLKLVSGVGKTIV